MFPLILTEEIQEMIPDPFFLTIKEQNALVETITDPIHEIRVLSQLPQCREYEEVRDRAIFAPRGSYIDLLA